MTEVNVTKKRMTEELIRNLRNKLVDEMYYSLTLQIQLVENSILPVQRKRIELIDIPDEELFMEV